MLKFQSRLRSVQGDMKYEDIFYDKNQRVQGAAFITINRPKALNAITRRTIEEMYDAIMDAAADATVGVTVLMGVGDRAFSSGGDVKWEKENPSALSRFPALDLSDAMRKSPNPIIAAVKGYAVGGGNWLAYLADLTIAADNAIFGQNGARVGSPAGGYFVSYLQRIVGEKKAREMWYLCRRYSAAEALEMGLINFVAPLAEFDKAVDDLCIELLEKSPTVLRLLKFSFDQASDSMRASSASFVQQTLEPEFTTSDEIRYGGEAFANKERPDFRRFRRSKSPIQGE
jgi:dihydroxynaphthoic acid synthetase